MAEALMADLSALCRLALDLAHKGKRSNDMADIYSSLGTDATAPAAGAFAITPSDVTTFDQPTRAIYVGTGGTLEVAMLWGGTANFENVADGTLLPIRASQVTSGTTAGALVGLY
jgi:hypothetical protein